MMNCYWPNEFFGNKTYEKNKINDDERNYVENIFKNVNKRREARTDNCFRRKISNKSSIREI
jgi:hypothetical protein